MPTVEETRRANLISLVDQAGGVAKAAQILNRSSSQISQWTNALPDSKTGLPRNISGKSARYIEQCFDKPQGWLDQTGARVQTTIEQRRAPRADHLVAEQSEPYITACLDPLSQDSINDLLNAVTPELLVAPPSIRDAVAELLAAYCRNPADAERTAAAIYALLQAARIVTSDRQR